MEQRQFLVMVTGLEAYATVHFLSVYQQYKEGITRPLSVDEIHSYELDYELLRIFKQIAVLWESEGVENTFSTEIYLTIEELLRIQYLLHTMVYLTLLHEEPIKQVQTNPNTATDLKMRGVRNVCIAASIFVMQCGEISQKELHTYSDTTYEVRMPNQKPLQLDVQEVNHLLSIFHIVFDSSDYPKAIQDFLDVFMQQITTGGVLYLPKHQLDFLQQDILTVYQKEQQQLRLWFQEVPQLLDELEKEILFLQQFKSDVTETGQTS